MTLSVNAFGNDTGNGSLKVGKFAKKAGVQKQFSTAASALDDVYKHYKAVNTNALGDAVDAAEDGMEAISNTVKYLGKLQKIAKGLSYLGAAVDLALIFLPEQPDPVLLAVEHLSDQVDSLHSDMDRQFRALASKNITNLEDHEVFQAIKTIRKSYVAFEVFQESLLEAGGSEVNPNIFRGDLNQISGVDLYGATDTLASLCKGTPLYDGASIFGAHIESSNGDVRELVRIGEYIMLNMMQVQMVHASRILYDQGSNINADTAKTAIDRTAEVHAKNIDICANAFESAFANLNKFTVFPRYSKKALEALFSGRKPPSAKRVGKFLSKKYPQNDWAVVIYPTKDKKESAEADVHTTGARHYKMIDQAGYDVAVSYFNSFKFGRNHTTNCASLLRANHNRSSASSNLSKYLTQTCARVSSHPFVFLSTKENVDIWASDFKAIKYRDSISKPGFTFMVVGDDENRCSGKVPFWSNIAGVGGYSNEAWFFSYAKANDAYLSIYDKRFKCFVSNPISLKTYPAMAEFSSDITAVLDYTAFKKGNGPAYNFFFMTNGTYVAYKLGSNFKKFGTIKSTIARWKGLSQRQAKTIVGATAIPSENMIYFFFNDGNYSRYDQNKKKVVEGPIPVTNKWPKIANRSSLIRAVADFENNNSNLYLFHTDEKYSKIELDKGSRIGIRSSRANWK